MSGGSGRSDRPIGSVALISSHAFSLSNFRGPLIRALVATGVRVYALAPDFDAATRFAVEKLGAVTVDFTLDRTGIRPIRDALDLIRLIGLLRRLKPDATLAYFIKPVIYGSLAARLAGVRRRFALVAGLGYVFTPDGGREGLKRRVLKMAASLLYKVAFRACETVFFQNRDDVDQFVRSGILSPDKIVLLNGTGVDLEHLAPTPPLQRPPTFLLMARLLREKGIVEFVEAARAIKRDHPEARFLLLGGSDPNPGGVAESLIREWVEQGDIEWLGHVADVRPWIAASSVFVLPSYREGKPRSTQEAMAMARAVITTDAPGCRDTVEEGVNGYLVPVRDSAALANAMRAFIAKPALMISMGWESRRLAEQRFDVHAINRIILANMGLNVLSDD